MTVSQVDVLEAARPFLALCGVHDGDIPTACTCPDGDPRPLIAALAAEVERQRAIAHRRAVAIGAVRRLCRSYTPEPPPLFRGPGMSEHGVAFNAGTRTLAEAVLGQLNYVLNPDGGEDE